MSTPFHAWRAAIRIARRDAWRFKGRSALVLSMIALPIVGVSAVDITVRSSDLTMEQQLTRDIGAADARLNGTGIANMPIYQGLKDHEYAQVDEKAPYRSEPTDITKAFPAGARTLEDTSGSAKSRTTHGLLDVDIRELKAADPMAAGIMTLKQGRFPAQADEVAATTEFLKQSGLKVGDEVSFRDFDRKYTVTGSYELPDFLKDAQLNALPGALLAPYAKALTAKGLSSPDATVSYLADVKSSDGFTWNMVKQANTKGVYVTSRAVKLDPPARSEVALYVKHPEYGATSGNSLPANTALLATTATVVGLAMLEICLLAGPAFAVGARRSRRQLGLVGANGGDRRHIRAIVLAGGGVIGAVAAVTGTALGLGLTVLLRPFLEEYAGQRFGGIEIRPLELLGIALLALVTGLLAAIVPAVVASRQSVLSSLTGRRGIRRANRVLPVFGAAAVCLGTGLAFIGATDTDNVLAVGGGSAIAELGIVALTPTLVGLFGRLGRWLPLSPRLALRDAVRNRGRTAPAVAAVLAAVAGTVAIATYAASSDQESRDGYTAYLPNGTVSLSVDTAGSRELPAVKAAVEKDLPVAGVADFSRIVVGEKTCDVWSSDTGCGYSELVTPKASQCPLYDERNGKLSTAQKRKWAKNWRCASTSRPVAVDTSDGILVGDASILKALGVHDTAAEKALADGRAVVFDKRQVDKNGRITLALIKDYSDENTAEKSPHKTFVAYRPKTGKTNGYGVTAVVSQAAAKAAGVRTVPYGMIVSTSRMPSSTERQTLDGAMDKLGVQANIRVEEGYVSKNSVIMLALAIFAGLVTIGAAGIATGLAQADAEPDLRTLTAVGAPPRVRRTLSGFQCGVVAAMGVLLGSAAGTLPAVGLRKAEERQALKMYHESLDHGWGLNTLPHTPIVVPWATLAALIVAVPLGAALLAALVTRSRSELARRAEG
ncbi:FtsX-like permease family protein [Actinacidiphila soli]|uniref:FtsX-like permease family protein n=1 Tax=Actinacidiphila soli TaxID=2487275 RepID=UPI000FCBD09E|nr:ABC transporter permease [Actinacidiphila soli]